MQHNSARPPIKLLQKKKRINWNSVLSSRPPAFHDLPWDESSGLNSRWWRSQKGLRERPERNQPTKSWKFGSQILNQTNPINTTGNLYPSGDNKHLRKSRIIYISNPSVSWLWKGCMRSTHRSVYRERKSKKESHIVLVPYRTFDTPIRRRCQCINADMIILPITLAWSVHIHSKLILQLPTVVQHLDAKKHAFAAWFMRSGSPRERGVM